MIGPARRAARARRALEAGRGLIGRLEEAVRRLTARADSLEEENRTLRDENEALRDENERLRAELAKKGRREKRQAAPFSRDKRKENPKKPGRKPGSAYGRQGNRPPPNQVDRVLEAVLPACCPDCGGRIGLPLRPTGACPKVTEGSMSPSDPMPRYAT
jgi:hypothetical protein